MFRIRGKSDFLYFIKKRFKRLTTGGDDPPNQKCNQCKKPHIWQPRFLFVFFLSRFLVKSLKDSTFQFKKITSTSSARPSLLSLKINFFSHFEVYFLDTSYSGPMKIFSTLFSMWCFLSPSCFIAFINIGQLRQIFAS